MKGVPRKGVPCFHQEGKRPSRGGREAWREKKKKGAKKKNGRIAQKNLIRKKKNGAGDHQTTKGFGKTPVKRTKTRAGERYGKTKKILYTKRGPPKRGNRTTLGGGIRFSRDSREIARKGRKSAKTPRSRQKSPFFKNNKVRREKKSPCPSKRGEYRGLVAFP